MEWNSSSCSEDSVHTFQFLWLTLLMFVNVMRVKPVFVSSASSNNPSSEVEWFIIPSCLKSESVLDTDYWLFRSPGTGWGWDYSDCSDHSTDLRAQIWQLCWYSVLTPDANTSQPQPALIISPAAQHGCWPDQTIFRNISRIFISYKYFSGEPRRMNSDAIRHDIT